MPYRFPELQPLTLHHEVNCIPRSVADETMNSVSVQSHGRVTVIVEGAVGHLALELEKLPEGVFPGCGDHGF